VAIDKLIDVDFTPMCAPAFLARHPLTVPADLLHVAQISPDDEWWGHWLAEAGVDGSARSARGGIRLDSQAHDGHAAMGGQGVAMLTPFLWRNDLAEGRLVQPFAQVCTRGYGYWLVVPEHRRRVTKIKRFREWLLAEVAAELGGAASGG
jgi:LysR family glycine cleavage system transcriptional activator